MRKFLFVAACAGLVSGSAFPQDPAKTAPTVGHSTVIGCLSGPDADDHYTLMSMQHRQGVDVVGSDDLKKASGFKVKLNGSWEALPGSEGKTGDAAKRFKASDVTVMEEKSATPQAVTPIGKKKREEEKRQQQTQQQQK